MPTRGETIRELLERDPVCEDIVNYLNAHTRAVDTARGIAEWWIDRDVGSTQAALVKLADHGVVRSYAQGPTRMYAYTKNPLLRRMLSGYLKALDAHDESVRH